MQITDQQVTAANRGFAQALADPAASFAADFPQLVVTPAEQVCRDFAREYPTPNVRRAIRLAAAGDITWAQLEAMFQKILAEALAPAH